MPSVLVVRYGAFGDMVMITPALRLLKQAGWRVVVNCRKQSSVILSHNPYVDELLYHDDGIPNMALDEHWRDLEKKYDRFINLSESIEKALLPGENKHAAYDWPHEVRHARLNVNYYDRTNELCGFPEAKGLNGELYFSQAELNWGRQLREQYKHRFWVLWSLSGSAFHKTYPFADQVATEFLSRHRDAMTMTVGDDLCRLLEWDHPQNKKRAGIWSEDIRKSLVSCKFADVVVATETGIANAAACFDTPKLIMLSHSSVENLTKYWTNCTSLIPTGAACYPCHQLHFTMKSCPTDKLATIPKELQNEANKVNGDVIAPICNTRLKPEALLAALEQQYQNWKERSSHGRRYAAAA